jgi:acetyl esterase/lipase
MVSLAARAIGAYSRLAIKRQPRTPEQMVSHLRARLDNPIPPLLMPGVKRQTFAGNGVHGDLITVGRPAEAVLYLHGGGFIAGVTRTYLTLAGKLARALKASVYLPAYRLAPEHPFPAALDDALACYTLMLKQFPANRITIMGDSAGGGLALGMLLSLRDKGMPLPKCGVAYSPYADVTQSMDSRRYNDKKDDMFTRAMFTVGINLYAASDEERRSPYASPAFGDYHGIPPLFITVSEDECLRDDAHMVAERARLAGVDVEFVSRRGLVHDWPIFYPLMPEARLDVRKTIRFIQQF